jgi:hypothetical protein
MAKYVLKSKRFSGVDSEGVRRQFKKGEIVELTAKQAAAFKGHFDLAEVAELREQIETTAAKAEAEAAAEEEKRIAAEQARQKAAVAAKKPAGKPVEKAQ